MRIPALLICFPERHFYICAQEKCRKKVLRSNIALYVLLCKITVQHWQHCQLSCKSSRNSSNRTARGDGSEEGGVSEGAGGGAQESPQATRQSGKVAASQALDLWPG